MFPYISLVIERKKYENGRCTNIATICQNSISGLFNEQKLKNSYSVSYSTKNMKI